MDSSPKLLFDLVPKELLFRVFDYSHPQIISICNGLFPVLGEIDIISYMRKRARAHTKLKTDNYHLEQLVRICKLPRFNNLHAGCSESYIIKDDGSVYIFGIDYSGENITKSQLVSGLDNIIQITSGSMHTLALTADGHVYAFGEYGNCKLGLAPSTEEDEILFVPTIIPNLNNIIQVATGENHSLALSVDGIVYSFGSNFYKQLGRHNDTKEPSVIPNLNNICAIAAGGDSSSFLTDDGRVYVCGGNMFEELGFHGERRVDTPKLIPNIFNIIQISMTNTGLGLLNDKGHIHKLGTHCEYMHAISPGIIGCDLKYISLNFYHLLAITNDNHVYTSGFNLYGQMGLSKYLSDKENSDIIPGLENVISVSAGDSHSLVQTSDNKLNSSESKIYVFGNNLSGQLGIPNISSSNVPILLSF